jgi:hypothetical protein
MRKAFTLFEILATLVIGAVVFSAGIGVVTSVQNKSQVSTAQRTLERAILSQITYAGSHEGFATDSSDFSQLLTGRGFKFILGASLTPNTVSVYQLDGGAINLAIQAYGTKCLGVNLENPYSSGLVGSILPFEGSCDASLFLLP